jgi:hypothetical protein
MHHQPSHSSPIPLASLGVGCVAGQFAGAVLAYALGREDKLADYQAKGLIYGGIGGLAWPIVQAIARGHGLLRLVP